MYPEITEKNDSTKYLRGAAAVISQILKRDKNVDRYGPSRYAQSDLYLPLIKTFGLTKPENLNQIAEENKTIIMEFMEEFPSEFDI